MTAVEPRFARDHFAATRRKPQPPVKAGAEELLDVSFTVNGASVTIRVPPRMHLADALRIRLGLSGTHLGCEHGVCGMCTVLVDGDAARSCLIFAVQAEGTEIVTVEGLGTQDSQHPLQRAFSHHHALQCGFCTPGFLMSSYDLLSHRDERTEPIELSEELSGVICRCTGYRGILAAVADVADTYPDDFPPPMNCAQSTVLSDDGTASVALAARDQPQVGDDDGFVPTEVARPTGTPTFTVEMTRQLKSTLEDVWAVMDDIYRLARCLPGAEMTADLGHDHYRGRAKMALGPVRLAFQGLAKITERDATAHRLSILAQGADTGGNRTAADITLQATSNPDSGTDLRIDAAIFLSGRIAQFGRALAGDVSQRLFEQFAEAVDQTALTGTLSPPRASATPILIGVRAALAVLGRRVTAMRTDLWQRLRRSRGD